MKQYFLWAMAVMIPAGIIIWFVWTLGKGFGTMFQDWRLHRELDDLQAKTAAKKQDSPTTNSDASDPSSDAVDYTSRM